MIDRGYGRTDGQQEKGAEPDANSGLPREDIGSLKKLHSVSGLSNVFHTVNIFCPLKYL